jgi:hypothetical protein
MLEYLFCAADLKVLFDAIAQTCTTTVDNSTVLAIDDVVQSGCSKDKNESVKPDSSLR